MSKHVNLDALIDAGLSVTLGGEQVKVRPMDGASYQLLLSVQEGGDEKHAAEAIDSMYKIASNCLSSLTHE